jgi:uncharacterized protein YidB (DUF937 family)
MDDISNMLSQMGGQGAGDPLASLGGISTALAGVGGLDGLMDKLRAAGLGDAVDSWISKEDNQDLDPAALGQALGPDTVNQLAAGSGIDVGQLLPMLAAFLPQIVDLLTPGGSVPSGGLDGAAGSLPDLGGILGGLLGGR